nr:unnamed protein product [Digitaria exilis]
MAGNRELTQVEVGDLPEVCLAHAIALTSPRDAADSDHASRRRPARMSTLNLCDAGAAVPVDGGNGMRLWWLDKASGAKCYMLSARALSLPWDDGEFSWRWTPHPLSRERRAPGLGRADRVHVPRHLRSPPGRAELTPATSYAAYLVYGVAEGHRGLSYPDQETTVAFRGARAATAAARHAVCLHPDEAAARKFRAVSRGAGEEEEPRRPRLREYGWSEMEIGRLRTPAGDGGDEVVVSFEVLGWYPKRGLIVEGVEFRPVVS